MPAPAVTPAPIVYIKVVVVKKLVVDVVVRVVRRLMSWKQGNYLIRRLTINGC